LGTKDVENAIKLVIFAHDVFLLAGGFTLVARRKWEARGSSEQKSVLWIDTILGVLFGTGDHFAEDASDAPHINGSVILLLNEDDLWGSIPS